MNKIILIGRIGRDAELRYSPDGKAVCGFSMAVDDGYGEKKSTIWVRCSLWGDRADKLAPHLTKGKPVYVEGSLSHDDAGGPRTWVDKTTNETRTSFECRVTTIEFLPGAPKSESGEEPF